MTMRFSVLTQAFYAKNLDYGDSIPVDVVDISAEQARKFLTLVNSGCRIYSESGALTSSQPRPDAYHSWNSESNSWELTDVAAEQQKQDMIENAIAMKAALRSQADSEIVWRQGAVDEGIATAEELSALSAWNKYRVMVMRVDASKPEWPQQPA